MRWIAYMPLRGGSRSIPDKNIRLLAGRPLFAWALGAALESGCFDEVWVGTDADRIRDAVEQWFPGRVRLFRRASHTCTDEASTESALMEFATATGFDVLCTVQATSPLTRAEDFRSAYLWFRGQDADSLLTATRVKRFLWTQDGRPLNYDPSTRQRRQDFRGSLMENGAFYLTRRAVLMTQQCRLGGRILIHEMPAESAVEIDEPSDWAMAERLLRRGRIKPESLARIRGLVVDVDGTLTDGGMYYDAGGESMKKFNTRDAHGLQCLEQAGLRIGVITAERSAAVDARMRKLEIRHYLPGQHDKRAALETLAGQWDCALQDLAYIGDDLTDLPAFDAVGVACCPADAVEVIRERADYVAVLPGGAGAVREVCELLLAASNRS